MARPAYPQLARSASLLLVALALVACQPGWVRLDGTDPGQTELRLAEAECRDAASPAQAQPPGDNGAAAGDAVNANEARMLRLEDEDAARRRAALDFERCMRRLGLRPGLE